MTSKHKPASYLVLLEKELRSAVRFYPIILSLTTVNLAIAVGAPIIGAKLANTVDILSFMILLTTYTMMGFSVSSFAEDKQDGTLEILVACPVHKINILLAKLSLGLLLAVPFALLPYGISAYFFMGVPGTAVLGLALASVFASLTATSVALLLVVIVKRIEVGVYLGFMAAWILSFTPSYILRLPTIKFFLPGYYIRDLFLSVGRSAELGLGNNMLILAALSAVYLGIAAWFLEKEDAILSAA